MTVTRNADVSASALDLILEQFKGKAKIAAFIGALVAEWQVLEDLLTPGECKALYPLLDGP